MICPSIVLVESFPLGLDYGRNVSAGVSLYEAWKDLLSSASKQIDVASFYWCLTGEDISVNSSSDRQVASTRTPCSWTDCCFWSLMSCFSGQRDFRRVQGFTVQKRVCARRHQHPNLSSQLHRPESPQRTRSGAQQTCVSSDLIWSDLIWPTSD